MVAVVCNNTFYTYDGDVDAKKQRNYTIFSLAP